MNPASEAEELGAGVLDHLRGFYPVADDMPPMYHEGARIMQKIETLEERLANHGLTSCPECGAEIRPLDCDECAAGKCPVWICTMCDWESDHA